MDNLDLNQNVFGNNGNKFGGIEQGIEDNHFNSNEIGGNEQGGYDSFKSLELEELEREFDRLFGTFTENEPEVAKTTIPGIENGVDLSNANVEANHKTNVFGNYKTGVDLGENPTGVFGNYGINDTNVNPTGVGSNINSELNLETNNTPGTAHGVFGNYDINSNLNNDIQANQQEAQVYQQTIKNPTETVFQTYQQTQQPQKQQAVTVVKKVGFWAKIKAFFTGSSTTTVTTNNKATSTQVGYNQNLNATNTNGQANNNSTTSKGFWSIFKGNK